MRRGERRSQQRHSHDTKHHNPFSELYHLPLSFPLFQVLVNGEIIDGTRSSSSLIKFWECEWLPRILHKTGRRKRARRFDNYYVNVYLNQDQCCYEMNCVLVKDERRRSLKLEGLRRIFPPTRKGIKFLSSLMENWK